MLHRRSLAAVMVMVMLVGMFAPAVTPRAHAAADETSTFMFKNATTFNGPNLDMVQGYTPSGASTSCPGALGTNWTCTWSSDTFAAGQSMAAGTTTVHLYPENNVSTIAFRAASKAGNSGIRFRNVGTYVAGTTNVTPGLPSVWQPNDIHILVVEQRDNVVASVPAGWTPATGSPANGGATHRASLWWRRAVAGDTAPTVTHAGGDSISAQIIGFSGVDTTTAFDVNNSFTASAADLTTEAAAITTVTPYAMLVFTAHMADNHTSSGLPTGTPWTSAFYEKTTTGSDSSIFAAYGIRSAAGLQPALSATRSGGLDAESHGAQIALRPPTLTINKPTGTVENDVMVASIAVRPETATITAPAGWTLVRRTDNAAAPYPNSLAVYWKTAGASEPTSYTWTPSVLRAAGGIQAFSGVDTTTPVDVEDGQTTVFTNTPTTPSITTTVANTMLVSSHVIPSGMASFTPPVGMTEAYDVTSSSSTSDGISMEGNYLLQAAAGTVAGQSATGNAAGTGHAHILALRPASRTATLTVQLLQNTTVLGSTTVGVTSPTGTAALASVSFATTAVTFADSDRLHVKVIAPNDASNVSARVSYDGSTQQSRLVTPVLSSSCAVAEAVYAAATASSGQVTTYWSSPNAVMILEKAGASITEAPVNLTTYSVGATIGGATVRANSAAGTTSFTRTGLTPGTAYYYKLFPKSAAGCYAAGTEVNGTPPSGTRPSWSYMHAGGSMLKPGITGIGSIYTGSNASRIVSLDTATGLHNWSPVSTTQPVQGWLSWVPNNGYSSRQTVTITAGAPGAPNGYSVPITLNHASLVAAGSSRADGNDVRVVYWSGTSGVELDRVLDSGSAWNTASTKIWIKTQAAIGASGSDSNYHVYYGNPVAGSPPADPMSVYLFYDDFSGAAIDTTKWTVTAGSVTLSGGIATVNANSGIFANTAYAFGVDVRSESRVQLTGDGIEQYFDFHDAVTLTDWSGAVISMWTDATNVSIDNSIATGQRTVLTVGLATPLNWHTYAWNREGTAGIRYFQDSTQLGYINTNVPTVNIRSYIQTNITPNTMKLDWHRVRRYVTPEPTTALATAESQTWGSIIGGDQSGRVYSVDAVVGAVNWTADLSAKANAIQAGIAAQIWSYSDAAFKAAYTTDVLFAASRNTGVTNCGTAATNNKLFALRADTGATLWTFNDTCTYSIDYIVGMPYVDYTRNRVYVATRGTGSTLWILNTLNGAVVQQLALGNLDTSPALSADGATIYVGNAAGLLYAVDTTTFTATSYNLASAVKSVIWEDWSTPGRLYFTTMDGNLWGLQHNGGASFTPLWTVAVAGASTPLFLDKLYVGSSDGRVHEFDIDGTNEKVFPASGTLDGSTVGDVSTEDGTQVFVGTNGGKLFKIQVPLP